ncbi:GntR family transcriptional regulator [Leifsonia xyli subsp. cynodontis DSM 46306]|uniref:HTH gntR-type domain-containing protein n=1 Tax=Leifsonia xyli subsp. cynodontis DSM 46306 TaxID=1389489 RepID=U3PAH7_LEIXC|nr:GntR family transcriptional regulator [Leifsonia xyli]AGW40473.1 GntR family transcriptional regulator [Leifsonia xyli subsp. cynodontis DSM 46306]
MPVPITEAVSPRRLIRDEVFERLLDAIVGGDLTPGEQLYDAEIEKWAGVSRTPVREALNQLAAMGLVEILPQKRTRVTPINPARLRGLIETTGTLLSGVARDATPFLTDADKQKLRDFQERISGGTDRLDRDRALTESFINVFVRRLDNKTIARLANRHLPEVRRALIVAPTSEAFEKAQPFVGPIVDAAMAGDGKAVAQGVAGYWNEGLITVVEEFEALERNS